MNIAKLRQKLLQRCYRFLSLRNRSEKEIRDYLKKKIKKIKPNNSEKIIDLIVHQLKEEGLIDDKKFIRWWVEQRSYFRPRGVFALRQELQQKGVNRGLIDRYFKENKIDQLSLAKRVLEKKQGRLKPLTRKEKFKKAIEFLRRRGFSYEVAKQAFKNLQS